MRRGPVGERFDASMDQKRPRRRRQERRSPGRQGYSLPALLASITDALDHRCDGAAADKRLWKWRPHGNQRTVPTGTWKSRQGREIPTFPQPIILFLNEETTKNDNFRERHQINQKTLTISTSESVLTSGSTSRAHSSEARPPRLCRCELRLSGRAGKGARRPEPRRAAYAPPANSRPLRHGMNAPPVKQRAVSRRSFLRTAPSREAGQLLKKPSRGWAGTRSPASAS